MIDATGYQLEPTPWARRAACAGTDPELWFPNQGAPDAQAKAICDSCPVRQQCLDYALRWDIQFGMWGGLSTRERRRLRRKRDVPRIEPRHGTRNRYEHGCRCDDCRTANYQYQRQWRAQ